MTIIGPRIAGKRAPISISDEEAVALHAYRQALLAYRVAEREERIALSRMAPVRELQAAYSRSHAATERLSAALMALNVAIQDGT